MFIALGLGVLFGFINNIFAPDQTIHFLDKNILTVLETGFIRLIQFIVIPLVLVSLVIAMSNIGDLKEIGKYSVKLLGLYLFTSSVSLPVL